MFETNSVWNSKLDSAQGLFCFIFPEELRNVSVGNTLFPRRSNIYTPILDLVTEVTSTNWLRTELSLYLEMVWRWGCSRAPISWFSKFLLTLLNGRARFVVFCCVLRWMRSPPCLFVSWDHVKLVVSSSHMSSVVVRRRPCPAGYTDTHWLTLPATQHSASCRSASHGCSGQHSLPPTFSHHQPGYWLSPSVDSHVKLFIYCRCLNN